MEGNMNSGLTPEEEATLKLMKEVREKNRKELEERLAKMTEEEKQAFFEYMRRRAQFMTEEVS